jgi:hypothetical protein
MTHLAIHDLAHSRDLDRAALSAVRGGLGDVTLNLDILHNVGIGVTQNLNTPVNVLNGSFIGAPTSVAIANLPSQLAGIALV